VNRFDATTPYYTRDQLIAFLAAWMKKEPGLTLTAARAEGLKAGFTVGRREYEEARREATGSPLHPQGGVEGEAPMEFAVAPEAAPAAEEPPSKDERPAELPVERTAERAAPSTSDARTWLVAYLKARPQSPFAEVKAASIAAGFGAPTPIGFGLARKAAALPPMAPAKKAERAETRPTPPTPAPAARGERKTVRDDGGEVFGRTRKILEEREQLLAALKKIDEIVRRAL
jgi:hypothetical protein